MAAAVLLAVWHAGCRRPRPAGVVNYGIFPPSSAFLSRPFFDRLRYFSRSGDWVDEPVSYTWADARFTSAFNAALHYQFRVIPKTSGYSLEAFAVSLTLRYPLGAQDELLANAFLDFFERHFSANFARLRDGLQSSTGTRPAELIEVDFASGGASMEVIYHPERRSDFLTLRIRDRHSRDR
jgi:hypothetical protein